MWLTHRCPGRDLNTGFAQHGWQQGMMAFTHTASLLGPCHTMVNTPTLQELWSRWAGPGFKDAALFVGISLVWERTTSCDTPGMLLCPLPALLLSESGYSCCVLWLALIVRFHTTSSTCRMRQLTCVQRDDYLGSNSGAMNPHSTQVPNSRL